MNATKCPGCDKVFEFEEDELRIDMECDDCGMKFCAHKNFPTRQSKNDNTTTNGK